MRLLWRLCGYATVALLFMLFALYQHRSTGFTFSIQSPWRSKTHRIIVFGDDWSDTGSHRGSPRLWSSNAARDSDRGMQWTETLCKELDCNIIENFARSLPITSNSTEFGPLVDLDTHAQARNRRSMDQVLPDFKTQVQQFLELEKGRPHTANNSDMDSAEWTVTTVYFGLWDLLEYVNLEKEFAMRAIDTSIAVLFQTLDLLAMQIPGMKVVMPLIMDLTFLPRFQSTENQQRDNFAERQHFMVFLCAYWNAVLSRVAKQWHNGQIVMPDPNSILLDLVAAQQLYPERRLDALDDDQQSPMFDNVVQPCLTVRADTDSSKLNAATVEKCGNPAAHLFWDSVRLGGIAQQLIGEEAASLMRSNQTVNIVSTAQGPVSGNSFGAQEGGSFNLKFPPGY